MATQPGKTDNVSDVAEGALPDRGRIRLHLTATLCTTSRRQSVTLRNISSGGAMIEAPSLPEVGRIVQLKRGAIDVLATIVWAKDGRAGLEFFERVCSAHVVAQLNAPPEQTFVTARDHYWRLREYEEPMSPEEWEHAKSWASQSGFVSKS